MIEDNQISYPSVSDSEEEDKKENVRKHATQQVQDHRDGQMVTWNLQDKVVPNFGHQFRSKLISKAFELRSRTPLARSESHKCFDSGVLRVFSAPRIQENKKTNVTGKRTPVSSINLSK